MTVISPPSDLLGSRRLIVSAQGIDFSGTTDETRYVIGGSTRGLLIGGGCRMSSLRAFANVRAASADATFTVTAYKNSVSSGTRIFETTLVLTAVAEVSATATSVTNAGMDAFDDDDTLILRYVYDGTADAATVDSINFFVTGAWDD